MCAMDDVVPIAGPVDAAPRAGKTKQRNLRKKENKANRNKGKGEAVGSPGHDGALHGMTATVEEKQRFLTAFRNNEKKATEALEAYLNWRNEFLPRPEAALDFGRGLPDMFVELRTEEGDAVMGTTPATTDSRALWIWGAMYDTELPCEEYTMATVAFLDRMMARDSMEKVMVIIDGRPGKKPVFKNPNAWAILSWAKSCASVCSANLPERLSQVVLFPTPWYARAIFKVVKPFLDERTAAKIVLIDDMGSLKEYIDMQYIPKPPGPPAAAEETQTESEDVIA